LTRPCTVMDKLTNGLRAPIFPRRGIVFQARYLASQFNDLEGCKGGCMYLPDDIRERPWPMVFLQSLAAGLRKMAGELDPADEGGRQ
jgi:hypothetical protein